MPHTGHCHCGAIAYELAGEPINHLLCHCEDCRRSAGAQMVGWTMFPLGALTVTRGAAKIYESSENGRRHFCSDCGTGLFYTNDVMVPGLVDVRTGTLDDPQAIPAQAHIQTAERIGWMKEAHRLPEFERYPQMP